MTATDPTWVQMNDVLCLSLFYRVQQFTVTFIRAQSDTPEYIKPDDRANEGKSTGNCDTFLGKWLGRWNVNCMSWGAGGGFKIDVCYAFENMGEGGREGGRERLQWKGTEKILPIASVLQLKSRNILIIILITKYLLHVSVFVIPSSGRTLYYSQEKYRVIALFLHR